MISSINTSSYVNMYAQQSISPKMYAATSIATCGPTIEDTYTVSPEAKEKAESESLSGALKTATSGMGACAKCGALYMGQMPPICDKCGEETKSDEGESPKIEESAKTDAVPELDNNLSTLQELETSVLA